MTSWNPGEPPAQPTPGEQPPPYGQQPPPAAPYGQQPPPAAPYGQPAAGQAPYGQGGYGQPQYGQPAYGAGYPVAPPSNQYGQPAQPLPPGAVRPLSMGNRVLAFIIDAAIIGIPVFILYFILGAIFISSVSTNCSVDQNGFYSCNTVGGGGAAVVVLLILLIALAGWIGFIYMTGKSGQTPGKRIMGVKVVDAGTGNVIGFGRAFLRWFVQAVSNILCYAGLWSAFLDSNSGRYQGWHDKAANSVVISVK